MCIDRTPIRFWSQRGLSLIELIIFIVIVSVALAGVLTVLNITVKSSADPMLRKQMLSIAEALMEEVQLQPFTWCDPTDANAATATSTAGCATIIEGIGVPALEAGQTRSTATPFNNVNDYHGCGPGVSWCNLAGPIQDINNAFSSPNGYSAAIAITREALNGVGDASATSATLRITVTVCRATSCPSLVSDSIVLEGYRIRHSPNFF